MAELLSLILAGAVAGGLYAVMAAGLVLTYQASGVFNLGQGAVAFTAALAYFVLHQPTDAGGLGLPVLPAALLAVLVVAPLVGLGLDAFVFRRLARESEVVRLVGTIGVLIALPAAAVFSLQILNAVFGSDLPDPSGDQGVAPPGLGPSPADRWSLTRGVSITSDQLAVVLVAAAAAVGLWYLLRHTRFGLETRAAVDRPDLARMRGIDTDRSSRLVWILSSTLAGLAGVLIAPLFDLNSITFHMIVFISFTAVIAARLRSVPAAFVAGIALGIIQNLVNGYAPDVLTDVSGFRTAVPFILLFVFLLFLPSASRTAGTISEEVPPPDPRSDLGPWRRRVPWLVAAACLSVYMVFVADAYWSGVVNRGLTLGLIFASFVVVTGLGGMINLAQATFVTVGGFSVGWMVTHQWPSTVPVIMDNGRLELWVALPLAMVLTTLVGLLVALPSLRFGGLSLALATLALAFVGDRLVFQLNSVRNGSRGWSVPRPKYGPIDLGSDLVLFVVLLVLLAAVAGLIGNLQRSASGRAVLAVRSSSVAAATSGVDPVRSRLVVFAVSAALAGLGGGVFSMVNSPMTNVSAPPLLGIVWLAVAVTFGIRRPGGAVVAGLVYALFPVVLSGISSSWTGQPWSSIPDSVRDLIGEPSLVALLFGLGAVSLSRQPDGVLASVGVSMRERRMSRTEGGPPRDGYPERVVEQAQPGAAVDPVAETVLAVRGVRAGYGEVEVLHGVDVSVSDGEILCVFGANGAGKSTLAGVFAGLVAATKGSVFINEVDVTRVPPHRRVGSGLLVAPEARGLFPALSVEDNLSIRLRTPAARQRAFDRFPILGERRQQQAGLLSGGEQQQLALAVALADPPRVMVADEPTLGLSPSAKATVFDALRELRDAGTAIVLMEEQAGALDLADTVVVLGTGRVLWSGAASETNADLLAERYLGAAALTEN